MGWSFSFHCDTAGFGRSEARATAPTATAIHLGRRRPARIRPAGDRHQARAVLGFPEGRFLAYVLSVGYPSDKPLAVIERLNRRPFDEVVHRGRW